MRCSNPPPRKSSSSKKPPSSSTEHATAKSKQAPKPKDAQLKPSAAAAPPQPAKKTTLFSFQNSRQPNTGAGTSTGSSVAFTTIGDECSGAYQTLFDSIIRETRNADRIQAPQIGIAVFNTETQSSNFSVCLQTNGKTMGADGAVVASRSTCRSTRHTRDPFLEQPSVRTSAKNWVSARVRCVGVCAPSFA